MPKGSSSSPPGGRAGGRKRAMKQSQQASATLGLTIPHTHTRALPAYNTSYTRHEKASYLYNLTHAHKYTVLLHAGTIGTKSQEPFRLHGQQSLYTPPHYRAGGREIKKWMVEHKRQQLPAARQCTANTPGCWAHTTRGAFKYARVR